MESRLDHAEAYAAGTQRLRGMGALDRGYLVAVRGSSGAACGERPIISQCALLVALKRGVGRVAFGSGKTRRQMERSAVCLRRIDSGLAPLDAPAHATAFRLPVVVEALDALAPTLE